MLIEILLIGIVLFILLIVGIIAVMMFKEFPKLGVLLLIISIIIAIWIMYFT